MRSTVGTTANCLAVSAIASRSERCPVEARQERRGEGVDTLTESETAFETQRRRVDDECAVAATEHLLEPVRGSLVIPSRSRASSVTDRSLAFPFTGGMLRGPRYAL